MKITEAANRNQNVINHLINVWEASVRATHLFLSDDEIDRIKAYVPQALAGVAHLIIAKDENGAPIAFMGIENGTLEMLFVAPKERGKGVGKRLILYGIERCGVERLAVGRKLRFAGRRRKRRLSDFEKPLVIFVWYGHNVYELVLEGVSICHLTCPLSAEKYKSASFSLASP